MNSRNISRETRRYKTYFPIIFTVLFSTAHGQYKVYPYIQNPASEAMSIIWFTESNTAGNVTYCLNGSGDSITVVSYPEPAHTLDYSLWEDTTFFEGNAPDVPYKHRIRLTGLIPGSTYQYKVKQDGHVFNASFRTAPDTTSSLRIIAYSDSETEPESTGKFGNWGGPDSLGYRSYVIDQTQGYKNNLAVIKSRSPDLVFIAGDLVEAGGEQRNWDEFWKHNTNQDSSLSIAGTIPVMGIPGNHDYYEGPYLNQFKQPGPERAIGKFLTYFENPPNGSDNGLHEGRYYCLRYGAVTCIAIDACNNGVNGSNDDTNFLLLGESDEGGGNAPDFGPGSGQYLWLEQRLAEAQINSHFTFVLFHHAPYSTGPHGYAAGLCDTCDRQSGRPVRQLTGLFMKYGVDAVISGHDEIWERSEITGYEFISGNDSVIHTIQFYDVGVGGDDLRKPEDGLVNPYQKYIACRNVPETWQNNILVNGGIHYGHLEINVFRDLHNQWNALLTPVYVFPVYNETDTAYSGFERRIYNDEVLLTKSADDTVVSKSEYENVFRMQSYPNPFREATLIKYFLKKSSIINLSVYDLQGRLVKKLEGNSRPSGWHEILWDGTDHQGIKLSGGLYLLKIVAPGMSAVNKLMVLD